MNIEQSEGRKMVSANIEFNLWLLAKENLISFTDALTFGIRFKLAERTKIGMDYPENSLTNKIEKLSNIISQQAQEIQRLTEAEPKEELSDSELKEILTDGRPIN